MPFHLAQKVMFKHCDPAGMVFYPRYFEMMNDCVETFFAEALDWPFERFHDHGGVPTVAISTQFTAPSRHGDELVISLDVTRLGRSSIGLEFEAHCGDELRFKTQSTLVNIDEDGRPASWPDHARRKIEQFMEERI